MDIALNVTTAPQAAPTTKVQQQRQPKMAAKVPRNKQTAASTGFSFQFDDGAAKVKAIVARRRPNKTSTSSASSAPLKEQNASGVTQQELSRKSIALKRKTAHDADAHAQQTEAKKSAIVSDGGGLLLNVCSKPAAPFTPKLTKAERFNQRRAARTAKAHARKELAQNATLRLKKPRAPTQSTLRRHDEHASGFEIVKREQRNDDDDSENDVDDSEDDDDEHNDDDEYNNDDEHNADDVGEHEAEEDEQTNKVDPKARKSNAFRVKRPQDSSVRTIRLFDKNPEAKAMGQRLVRPITERLFDGTKIDTIGLHAHTVKNLNDLLSITELTTVQRKAIPQALEGKDLLVRSQTGSGKTLAYALPAVERLHAIRPKIKRDEGILAVIIVPTRELAIQTYELFVKLLKPFTWLVPGVLMGGERRKAEKARLRKGINILVGTPGRLVDHLLHTESFKLNKARLLVLDEADRLLEMGYERDVQQIVEAIDKQRQQLATETKAEIVHMQRMLLSATLTSAVQKLAGLTLQAPIFIDNSDEAAALAVQRTNGYDKAAIEAATAQLNDDDDDEGVLSVPENLLLSYLVVPPKLRLVTLSGLLAKEYIGQEKLKAVVFMSTTEMVAYHHDLLNEALTHRIIDDDDDEKNEADSDDGEAPLLPGLRFFKLYGAMTQTERQGVFKSFRECKSGVLLATDVVGRGIDVPEIDLVVQYSPPQKTADFVHRAGRTARAGRRGRAILFLTPNEVQFVRYLESKRIRICQVDMDLYLKALVDADDQARNIQEAASNLQYKFQELIIDDKELHDKGCKAFVSWVKFQSSFPRTLKPIFNVKNTHMGHYAKSLGLKDEPASFTRKHSKPKAQPRTNRLTYTERVPTKSKADSSAGAHKKHRFATTVTNDVRNANRDYQQHGNAVGGATTAIGAGRFMQMLSTSRALTTSEFDSGLPTLPKKQKRTNA